MVAIVSGNSLGLSLTSLAALGQGGTAGSAGQGRNGEAAFVNIANGNLVLQGRDERLVSRGLEVGAVRTYNSLGLLNDDNGDNWSLGIYSQQLQLTGTLLGAGSTLTKTERDGAQSVYAYDSTRNLYISTDGAGAYDTIAFEAGTNQFIWTDGASGQRETFENSAQGRLLTITDPQGNSSSYSYNANGTLAAITSSSGESLVFDYVGTNLASVRVVSSGGVVSTRSYYSYDANGRLSVVTTDLSPDDNSVADNHTYTTSYSYEGTSRRIATITQSDGTSLSFTYVQVGADQRVASVTDGAGQLTSYSYDTANHRTTVTDPLGLVSTYTYDAVGQLTQITAPAVGGVAQVRSFVYNAQGDVVQIIDAEGQAVSMEYDARGNQVLQRDAAGNTITRSFDARNQLIAQTVYAVADPDGAGSAQPGAPLTTRYVYDAAGQNRLRFALSAEGRVTEYRYDSYGQRTAAIQYSGAAYELGALGVTDVPTESTLATWAAAQNQALSSRVDMAYDFRGQLQSSTSYARVDASGNGVADGSQSLTQYVYSQGGQLLQTIAADGGVTAYTYDGLGRMLSAQNALTQTTLSSYDDANRKTSVSYANGLITTSTFDAAGRLISVLQSSSSSANLGTSQYFYDAAGRLRMTQDATGVRAWVLYDEAGRKVADIDGNGSLTEYLYNKNNQLTQSIAYATAVNVATLVNGAGQPSNPSLASIRPSASAQDRKAWNAYDSAGRLLKTVDAQGAVSENVYDGTSRVVATIRYATLIATAGLGSAPTAASIAPVGNAADRVSRSFYDADGLLRATLDAEGYLTELKYNAAGQLSSRIAYATLTPEGLRATGTLAQLTPALSSADQRSTVLLNARGQVAGEIDAEGYLTENIYDAQGKLSLSVRYASKVSAGALAALGAASTVADVRPPSAPEDRATSYSYDLLGRLTQETSPEGVLTQYSYDTAGKLSQTVRAVGTSEARAIRARYDLLGRLTGELGGVGAALLTGNQTQAEVDALWAQYGLSHTYDAASRRTSSTDQNGNKTLFFYDVDGRLTHSVNALGEVAQNQYDTLGQLTAVIRYGSRISLAALTGANAGGLVNAALTSAIDAVKNTALDSKTTYTYNTTGTLAASTDALANAISSIYNAFGEETSRSQAIGAGLSVVQTRAYDRRGLQTASVADVGGINAASSAVFDAFGRLISSTDANGNVRQQSYDRLGRAISSTDALNALRASSYDAFGRVLTQTDALGKLTSYVYDKSARSVAITTPEGVTITTVHNRLGQTQAVTDGRGNVTNYAYDKNGNLLSTGTALTTTSNQYDRANRLVQMTDANGNVVQLSYDAANRVLTRAVDPTGLNLLTSYQYDARGQQIRVTDAKGVVTQLSYDLKGQLLSQNIDPTGLALLTQYSFDARGKTLTVTSPSGSVVQYAYDKLGRRTQERVDPAGLNLTRSYAYDKSGNVTSAVDANGNVTRYAYDANDRLVYTLDPLGALRRNDYDAEGRIVKTTVYLSPINTAGLSAAPTLAQLQALAQAVANVADLIEHRVYDASGRLAASVNALGEVVKFSYDANNNVVERVAYANRITMGAWTPGTVPSVTTDAAHDMRQRTVYDQLNRALYSIDGTGAVVAQQFDGNGNVTERLAYSTAVAAGTAATQSAIASAVAAIANSVSDVRVRMVYDRANRLTWSANGVGAVTQQLFDANGRVTKTIQYATAIAQGALPSAAVASNADRISAYVFDAAGRLSYSIDALGGVQQTVYDRAGNATQRISYARAIAAPTAASTHTLGGTSALILADAANDRIARYAYDGANRLVISVNAQGAANDVGYDAAGNVVQTRRYATLLNTGGLSATATEAELRARLVADAANDRIERQTYDGASRLLYSVNSLGYVSQTSYDGAGRITATTRYALAIAQGTANTSAAVAAAVVLNPAGDRTDAFVYDTAGRLLSSTDALGYSESYGYNALGHKSSFTNKMGAVWSYDYDAAGRLTQETSPQVALATLGTNAAGQLIVNEAASGNASIVTALTYDALGNLLSRTEAQGRPEQRSTRYVYDALGRQIRTIYPEVGVYNAAADNLTVNGATGLATRTETQQTLYSETRYDALGNAVAGRDVAGAMSYKAYDLLGRVSFDVDAMGFVTGYTRNAWGESSQLTRYSAATTLASANPASLSASQIASALAQPGVDHTGDRTLLTEFDRLGRAVKVTEPQVYVYDPDAANGGQYFTAGKVTQNSFNAFGETVRTAVLKNPITNAWTATNHYYNSLGQQSASVDAMGYLTTQAFDGAGNVVARTEFATALANWNGTSAPTTAPTATAHIDDRTTLSTFDRGNRKVSDVRLNVEYSDPATLASSSVSLRANLSTSYGYDAVGNLTRTTDANGASTYSYYDALGRVKAVATPTRSSTVGGASLTPLAEFRRDAYGNVVVKIDYANGAASANEAAYTAGAADAADRTELAQYDRFGHVTQTTDAAGFNHYQSYDALGHVAKQWQAVTGNDGVTKTLFKAFQYDLLGKQTHVIDPASTTVFKGGITSSTVSSVATASIDENGTVNGYSFSGNNSVTMAWPSVVEAGGGLVRVQLDYTTVSTHWVISVDESGNPNYGGVAAHSATRTQDFTAAAALSGVTLSWGNASSVDGGLSKLNYIRIWQQNAAGAWIMKWEGTSAQTNGSGVADVTQAQAGVNDTALEYNAFGEVTRKGVNGGRQEYFSYDNAGHMWRTNSGDGNDKVSLYDLQGHQTAQIQSAGSGRGNVNLSAFTSADQVASLADVRRSDMRYDALGRLLMTTKPERIDVQGGVSINRSYALNNIAARASLSTAYTYFSDGGESGYYAYTTAWNGSNSVNLSWASLAGLGSGDVKVVMDYVPQAIGPLVGGTYGTYYDESAGYVSYLVAGSQTYSVIAGAATSRTQIVRGDQADSGITMSWADASGGSIGGLSKINRVQVFKKDLAGNWVSVVDQSEGNFGYKGNTIEVAAPTDPSTHIQLQIRLAGSAGETGWVTQSGVRFDAAWRFDASTLGVGNWEYRVLTTPAGQATRSTAAGNFTVAAPALSVISNTRSVGPAGAGIYGWANPGGGIVQTMRIRAAGSTGAWQTLSVGTYGGYTGVNLNTLPSGTFDYELLWTNAGVNTPYAHGVGQLTVVAAVTTTSLGPAPIIGRLVTGYVGSAFDESGNPVSFSYVSGAAYYGAQPKVYSYTVVAYDESNPIYGYVLNSGYLGTPIYGAQPTIYTTTPAQFGTTSTTQPNTAAVSQDTLVAATIAQAASLNGSSTWVRPVINQKVDRWGNVIQSSDVRAANWLSTFRYNANNQLVEQTQPDADGYASGASPVTRIYYDKMGNQVAVKDARGNVNGQLFDAAGQLVAERRADGGVVSYTYNAFGNKTSKTDARGIVNSYSYDKLSRLLQTAYGTAAVYTVNGSNALSFVNTRTVTETSSWDQAGRKLSQTNGNGETTRYTYDLIGNVLQTYFPLSGSARTVFDTQNRKTIEVDANGYSNIWGYDYFGQLSSHTDLANNRYAYSYDNARQLISQTSTLGQNKTYGYDAAGQLTRITDLALNQVSTYAYDFAGNHVQESTTQNGVVYQDNHMAYDALGRLRWVGDSRAFVNMEYDAVGNRTRIQTHVIDSATSYDENRYFQYDAMNRQIVVDAADALGTLGSKGHAIGYDLNGNRVSDSYQGSKVAVSLGAAPVIGYTATGYYVAATGESGPIYGYYNGSTYYGAPQQIYSQSVWWDESTPHYSYTPISGYYGTPVYGAQPNIYTQSQGTTTEQYAYDANNNLSTVRRDGTLLETRHYDAVGRVMQAQGNSTLGQEYFDKLYGAGVSGTGAETRTNRYDANGRLAYAAVQKNTGAAKYNLDYSNSYDAAGNMLRYSLVNYEGSAYTNTYNYNLLRRDSYLEGSIVGSSTVLQGGTTTNLYDANNNLVGVRDSTKGANNRDFITDVAGRILQATQNGNVQRQLVVNGEVLGRYGTMLNPDKPADSSGNPNFVTTANFNFGYTKISGSYPAANPGTRTVAAGDTLASIAKSVFGDSSLWYLIADANGLSGDRDLRVGQTITVPNRVTGAKNSASSFKPYNPGEVVGNTTPNLPSPPSGGGGGGGCGGLGMIIMIVVAVVATIYTAGAASAYFAGTAQLGFGATMAAGTTALASGASLGVAALAGAAGSLASQVVGNVLGMQQGIDWSGVALGAVGGAVSAGMSGVSVAGGAANSLGNTIARAALGNAMTQGVAVVTGLQKEFNWTSVAASAVGAGVGHAMSSALGGDVLPADQAGPVRPAAFSGMGDTAGRIARASLSGFAAGLATNAMRGGRQSVIQVATDAFGNAFGSSLGDVVDSEGAQEYRLKQAEAASKPALTFAEDVAARRQNMPNWAKSAEVSAGDTSMGSCGPGDLPVDEPSVATSTVKTVKVGEGQTLTKLVGTSDPATLDKVAQYNGLRSRHEVPAGMTLAIPDAATLANMDVSKSVAARGAARADYYAQRQQQQAEAAAVQRNENYGNEGRNVPAPVSPSAEVGRRASDQAFYNDLIANADNPATAVLATFGRAFNNAGHDIADGAVGLYVLATDKNVRDGALNALGNALSNPIDTATSAYNAGEKYVQNTSGAQMAEDALRFGAGGFATAGIGKGATALGGYALDGAATTGRWLAPKAAELAEGYMARTGGLAYAVEPGAGGATLAPVAATSSVSGELTGNLATIGRRLERLGYDQNNTARILQAVERGDQVVVVGENMKRVTAVARMVENAGGEAVTYAPRNWSGLSTNSLEANRSWIRYWGVEKGATVIDIGRQPTPRPSGPSPFYGIENRSLNRWEIYTPFK